MTVDRRPRTPWLLWLLGGIAALIALRFVVAAVSRLLDFVSIVVVLGVLVLVGWKVATGGRRSRHRD
jgi:hypothetical protein